MDIKRVFPIAALAVVSYLMVLQWSEDYGVVSQPQVQEQQPLSSAASVPTVADAHDSSASDVPTTDVPRDKPASDSAAISSNPWQQEG